ncbi:MAG: AAA family ATPase [Chloroflexi bacterium]|nr:AAA family ATPase [Chloroflexota bacterium]
MQAVIFVGIQGSGKSSFYKERFFNTHLRINLDMLKTRHREELLLKAYIEMQQSFVVDNTNPTIQERARYIEPARAARFRIIGYYFQSSVQEAIRRNNLRSGRERIPPQAIGGTAKRLQLPTLSEGFDELYYVTMGESGGFVVNEP